MKKTKWLIYTVLIGLIPFFIRFFIFLIRRDLPLDYILNAVDMVTFGLILHLTNILELLPLKGTNQKWRDTHIGLSIVMLILFSSFLGLTYFTDIDNSPLINKENIKYSALALGVVSFFTSYSIYDRLNKI